MSTVFLSHNSKDKPWVRNLATRLTSDGVVVWIDEAELNIGDSLIEKIAAGIKKMRFVAAVISTNSIGSAWVQKELNLAMSKEIAGRKVTVLPLLIENCEVPAFLADKLYADFRDPSNFEGEYERLLRAIGITRNPPVPGASQTPAREPGVPIEPPNDTELKIVGVIKERTHQDPKLSGLQDYYFKLSKRPPSGWNRFFDEVRSFPRHSMWRKAWIEGDCVVLNCALDEIEQYHLRDLKQDVATANEKYDEAVRLHEQQKHQQRQREQKLREERDGKLDELDFS